VQRSAPIYRAFQGHLGRGFLFLTGDDLIRSFFSTEKPPAAARRKLPAASCRICRRQHQAVRARRVSPLFPAFSLFRHGQEKNRGTYQQIRMGHIRESGRTRPNAGENPDRVPTHPRARGYLHTARYHADFSGHFEKKTASDRDDLRPRCFFRGPDSGGIEPTASEPPQLPLSFLRAGTRGNLSTTRDFSVLIPLTSLVKYWIRPAFSAAR